MNEAIESKKNRELAKQHVDYLGHYLEKVLGVAQKGIHADLQRIEAVKAVFHCYLVVADMLGYLPARALVSVRADRPNIHTATLDELQVLLGVPKGVATRVFKLRYGDGLITADALATVKGVGPKTVQKAIDNFHFDAPATRK